MRTYGRNEDHIYMVKIENDYEFWGDFADDEIYERNMIVGRAVQRTLDDYYYFNFTKQNKERECKFCFKKVNPDYNRFNEFLKHNDIAGHPNHFDNPPLPKKYDFDHDLEPCWCNNMPQFSRLTLSNSKYLQSVHPHELGSEDLIFESRFQSGNLARAVKVSDCHYELYLRPDMYTNSDTQWFYFNVRNMRTNVTYRWVLDYI